eukprot:9691793-Prorocentrum_lima.AAC.1
MHAWEELHRREPEMRARSMREQFRALGDEVAAMVEATCVKVAQLEEKKVAMASALQELASALKSAKDNEA